RVFGLEPFRVLVFFVLFFGVAQTLLEVPDPLTNRLAEVWDASRTEEEHQHNRNDDQLRRTEAENRERKEFLHAAEHLAPGRVGASRTHTGARPCLSLRRTLERPECRVNQGTHTSDGRHTPSADIT